MDAELCPIQNTHADFHLFLYMYLHTFVYKNHENRGESVCMGRFARKNVVFMTKPIRLSLDERKPRCLRSGVISRVQIFMFHSPSAAGKNESEERVVHG